MKESLLTHLKKRNLVAQISHEDELSELLDSPPANTTQPFAVYCGFDPTARSLHVGNLVCLMGLRRAQNCGLTPIILFGGATGLIGDPTGRTEMRQMHSSDDVQSFIKNFKKLVTPLFRYDVSNAPVFVNNNNWMGPMSWMDFARNVGVHFTVARLLSAEVNKTRLEHGLTFMELGYQLLQSYDFLHLNKNFNCVLQVGGNDQWSNILSGADLIRRVEGKKAFALTFPLLVASDGQKFGKSAGNAIWLDPSMTSPFDFFQFFRNVSDDIVEQCFNIFTFRPTEEIAQLVNKTTANINSSKEILAYDVTEFIHGKEAADGALSAAKALFEGKGNLSDAPTTFVAKNEIEQGLDILTLLVKCGLTTSKGEARKLIQGNGLMLNEIKHTDPTSKIELQHFQNNRNALLLKKGKKDFHLVKLN